ncbi:hypothetical protein SUGI_0611620 [Cryptomeria japonica]|nr:hypothetical protein SUGI_0611620 [Cryptomeria japonica]
MLFEGVLPAQVTEIRVQLHWYSPNLDERRKRLVDDFLNKAGHLHSFCVAGVPPVPAEQESQASPVFVRSKNWRPGNHGLSCMFIFSGGKRRPSPVLV